MHDALDDAVLFELPKLLRQHLLRHAWNGALQIGKAERLAAKQMKEDQELPPAFKHADGVLDADGGGRRRVCTLTHR